MHLKKVGGSKAEKPLIFKSGGLEPTSLIEVYTYDRDNTRRRCVATANISCFL